MEQIGDPWSLHLIRAAYLGLRRFQDFQELLDIPRQTLMLRLKKLTENAIFYSQPVRHKRIVYEYRQNGELRMIRVVPTWGKPYYLVPRDNTKGFGDLTKADMLVPQWVIAEFE